MLYQYRGLIMILTGLSITLLPVSFELQIIIGVLCLVPVLVFAEKTFESSLLENLHRLGYDFLNKEDILELQSEDDRLERLPPYEQIAVTHIWNDDNIESIKTVLKLLDDTGGNKES